MTDMNKNKEFTISCDSTIATRSEELENDPKFIMVNDGKVKKASIYHPPVRSSYIPTATLNAKCKELSGDQYKYTLGVPMSWGEFISLSDEAKKVYIEDILEKYPGISYGVIARFMDVSWKSVKNILDGIGIKQWKFVGNKTQMVYARKLAEKKSSDKSNLEIVRTVEIGNLPRYTYAELMSMKDDKRVKTYIQNVLDKYNGAPTTKNMAELLQCSTATLAKLYKNLNIKILPNYSKSKSSKKYKDLFKEEMLSKPYKNSKIAKKTADTEEQKSVQVETEPTDVETLVHTSTAAKHEKVKAQVEKPVDTKKCNVDISMIEFTSDVADVSSILTTYGFTGKVKIKVEKI